MYVSIYLTHIYAYIYIFYLIPNRICGDCIYEHGSLQVNYKFMVCPFGIINNNNNNNPLFHV